MPTPKKKEYLKQQKQKAEEEKVRKWQENYDRIQQAEKNGEKIYKAAGGRIRGTSQKEVNEKKGAYKSQANDAVTMIKLKTGSYPNAGIYERSKKRQQRRQAIESRFGKGR